MTRNPTKAKGLIPEGVEWFHGDIQKVGDLEKAFQDVDSLIVNLSSLEQASDKQWQPLHQGLATLLVFARMNQVRHVIFHSLLASHQVVESGFGLKLPELQQIAERFLVNCGIPFSNFRTSVFMESFFHRFRSGRQIRIHKSDEHSLFWVSAFEFGQQLANAICNPMVLNRTLYFQGNRALSLSHAARVFADHSPQGGLEVEILDQGYQKFLSLLRPKKVEEIQWIKLITSVEEKMLAAETWEILGVPTLTLEKVASNGLAMELAESRGKFPFPIPSKMPILAV